jgi:FkbM family methyltransferase
MHAKTMPGIIVEFLHRRRAIRFFLRNVADTIQNCHMNGAFYEMEELQIIEHYLKPGSVFLDIGTNVGNHAVYVGKYCKPAEIIIIEPNPEAIEILKINLLLNRISVDAQHLGLGLSDAESTADAQWDHNNLGGARMVANPQGAIHLATGDSLFADRHIDFIKMDIEGLEIAALNGLAKTIAASRPKMFIEVDDRNRPAFDAWCASNSYVIAKAYRRYHINENFLVVPAEIVVHREA